MLTIEPAQIFNIGVVTGFYGILLILLEFVYLLFAFILSRQIKLMVRSFSTPYDNRFRLLGLVHLFGAVSVIIMTLILL